MSRAALQKMYEVTRLRDQHAAAHGATAGAAATVAAAYAVVKEAKGREPVSAGFVETALTVHRRLLSHGANAIFAGDG